MDIEELKKKAGYLAASFVENGMILGLGTGSTAKYFIEKVIHRIKEEDLKVSAVASSQKSFDQAQKGGIPMVDINELTFIDLTVDGADEIDDQKRMIKGGGGALLREKIVASMSKEMVVIVDETKLVSLLGKHKLPVEVVPFAHQVTLHHIRKLGLSADFRRKETEDAYYVTDNGNFIIDIHYASPLEDPEKQNSLLKKIPGVIETGFFFHLAGRVIIAFKDGQITIKH